MGSLKIVLASPCRRIQTTLLLLVVLAEPSVAGAAAHPRWRPGAASDTSPSKEALDEARSHYRRGLAIKESGGDLSTALSELERAYDCAPAYRLLPMIGQLARLTGDPAEALAAFTRFLEDGGGAIPATRRAEVRREIELLRVEVAALEAHESASDAAPPGSATPSIAPPKEVTRLDDKAAPTTDDRGVKNGESRLVPAVPSRVRVARAVTWSVAGALAAAAVVTGALALADSRDIAATSYAGGVTPPELADRAQRTARLALVTDVLGGLAGAAALTALIVQLKSFGSRDKLVTDGGRATGAARPEVSVGLGRLDLAWRF